MIAPDGAAVLAPTARVSANGRGGGGTVAVGTTLARARTLGPTVPGTSARAFVAAGARVSADGRGTGSGGRVTVLSSERTQVDGTLTARGGKQGGDGGTVELSGAKGFGLTGTADTSAPKGRLGEVVLDPYNLDVVASGGTITPVNTNPNVPQNAGNNAVDSTSTVTASALQNLNASVRLQATNNVTVRASVSLGGSFRNFTVEAGNNVRIEPGVTVSASGDIRLSASSSAITGATTTGTVTVLGDLRSTGNPSSPGGGLGNIFLTAGSGGIALAGTLTAQEIGLNTPGTVTQTTGALIADYITTPGITVAGAFVEGSTGATSLLSPGNRIGSVGSSPEGVLYYNVGSGNFSLVNSVPLVVTGLAVPPGSTVSLTQNSQPTGGATPTNALTIGSIITSGPGSGPINLVLSAPAGVEVTSGAKTLGLLSVTANDLGNVNPGIFNNTLTLRSQAGAGPGGTVTLGRAGGPRFNFGNVVAQNSASVTSAAGFTTLTLDASGLVSQNAPVTVNRITGQAGTLSLQSDFNDVRELGTFTTASTGPGSLEFHNGASFVVNGPLTAGGGAGDIFLSLISGQAPNINLAADLRGNIVAIRSVGSLTNLNGGIQQTAGIITGDRLTLIGGSGTFNGANLLTNLGDVTLTQGLSLNNAQPLRVNGTVRTGTGALTLTAPAITETLTSTFITPTLNVTSPASTFDSPTNQISTLGSIQAPGGSFSVTNSPDTVLTINQVNAAGGQARFVADRVAGLGSVTGVTGGLVRFAPLTPGRRIEVIGASAADPNSLLIGPSITGNLTANTLALGQPGTAGPINFGNAGEFVNLGGRVGTVQVQTTGAVTQGAGARLGAADLVGTAGSLALGNANVFGSLGAGNTAPGTLTGFTTTGPLTFSAANTGLTLANAITAGGPLAISNTGGINSTATLSAPSISVTSTTSGINQASGSISTPGTLTLSGLGPVGDGGVSQSGGTITAGVLTGTNNGNVLLQQAGNSIAALGPFSTPANFFLTTNRSLAVTGPASGGFTVWQVGGDLTFNGSMATTSNLTLAVAGNITQPGGTLQAFTLNGSAASASLNQPGNSITNLGAFASTGGFSLLNGRSLTVVGPVTDPVRVSLQTAGDLTISTGSVSTGALSTVAAGNIIAPAPLQAQTLTGSAGGTAGFTSAGNSVGTLGAFNSNGGFTLGTNGALAVAGPVTDPTSVTLRPAGNLQLAGPVTTGALPITAGGAVTQPGGALDVQTLSGQATSASFDQPANRIGALGGFRATTGDFSVTADTTAAPLGVNGSVLVGTGRTLAITADRTSFGAGNSLQAPGGTVQLAALSPAGLTVAGAIQANVAANVLRLGRAGGGPVTITAPLALGSVPVLDLQSAGAITSTNSITVGTLTGSGASASLTGANRIGTLGQFTTTGAFALDNASALQVAGPVSAGSVRLDVAGDLQVSGNVSAPTVRLGASGTVTQTAGLVSAPTQLTLSAGAGVLQTGGTMATALLTGSSGRPTNLVSAGNAVGTLGAYASTGGFALVNGQSLQVSGPVTDATFVRLQAAGSLALSGPVTTGALTTVATGAITQPGGVVTAQSLTGSAGSASFDQAGNAIATLGAFSSAGDFSVTNGTPITVTGVVSAGQGRTLAINADAPGFAAGSELQAPGGTVQLAALSPTGLTVTSASTPNVVANTLRFGRLTGGPVTVTGPFTLLNVPVLDLQSAGAINAAGAAITVGTLTGTGASATLTGANRIGTLGQFTTAGAFALDNAANLQVSGPVSAGSVALDVVGNLTLNNSMTGNTVTLLATGAITAGPGGYVDAATLTGRADQVTLSGDNRVARLGDFTTTNGFLLTDRQSLAVTGAVADGRAVTLLTDGSMTLSGAMSAPTVALTATGLLEQAGSTARGSITQTAGTITAPTSLTLTAAGAVNQPGGTVTAQSLSGSAASASLTGANQIGTLGQFSTPGALTLNNVSDLRVSGADAGTLTLTAPNIAFTGPATAGTLAVSTSGSVTQGDAPLTAGVFRGTAGQQILLGQTGAATITELGEATAGGALVIASARPLTVTGPLRAANVQVSAVGQLTLAGGTIATTNPASSLSASGPAAAIVQTGTTTVLPFNGTTASLRLQLPATGGTITLNDLQAGGVDLVLALGTGQATGALTARSLLVEGAGGSAALTGSVAGQGGFTAAEVSRITPAFSTSYTFNNCAIASVSCVLAPPPRPVEDFLTTIIAPQTFLRPLVNLPNRLDLTTQRERDDPNILLPNISDRDY